MSERVRCRSDRGDSCILEIHNEDKDSSLLVAVKRTIEGRHLIVYMKDIHSNEEDTINCRCRLNRSELLEGTRTLTDKEAKLVKDYMKFYAGLYNLTLKFVEEESTAELEYEGFQRPDFHWIGRPHRHYTAE